MAFIVGIETNTTGAAGAGTTLSCPIPAGHQANDLLLTFISQDDGAGVHSMSGWTSVSGQLGLNGQRFTLWRKFATSSDEPQAVMTSTDSDGIVMVVVAVRGADQTEPIDVQAYASVTGSLPQAPEATTLTNNTLLFYAFSYDGGASTIRMTPQNFDDMSFVANVSGGGGNTVMMIGYKNQAVAGAATRPTAIASLSAEGGVSYVVAIRDDGNARMGPETAGLLVPVARHGGFAAYEAIAANAPNTLTATAIDGRILHTATVFGFTTGYTPTGSPLNNLSGPVENIDVTSRWCGVVYAPPVNDFSNAIFHLNWAISSYAGPTGSAQIPITVLEDASGNWAAYAMYGGEFGLAAVVNRVLIDPTTATPLDSAGTLDLTNIVKVAHLYRRISGLLGRVFGIGDFYLIRKPRVFGGSAQAPATISELVRQLNGWTGNPIAPLQGFSQSRVPVPIQVGDGTLSSYVDLTGEAVEHTGSFGRSTARNTWQIGSNKAGVYVKASATDTIRFGSCVVSALPLSHRLVIDPASSGSATYDWAGAVFLGQLVTVDSNVTINGATFSQTRGIELNDGGLDGCLIQRSLVSPAVETADPASIANCAFVSSGTGHAIEITQPGTYSFVGNTFEGYGVDGSTDAAIYNNSGGAVTLNISGGGDTPTVRNAAGCTTTINNNVTITLDGVVVGSSIRVEKVSDGSLVEFRVADSTTEAFSVSGGFNYRVKVRKASSAPKYEPFETQTGTITTDTTVFVQQVLDPIA